MNQWIVFAAGMMISAISGRITLVARRGGIERPMNAANAVRDIIGLFGGLCFWALIVWGLSALHWYVALPIILVAGFSCGLFVTRSSFSIFFLFEPIFDVFALVVTGWLWINHWPY